MMACYPEHPKWDQNPKFTPLSETTSIPTPFICLVPPPRASILAKGNWHLFTFAFVQLKFVRRTHRYSATYSLTVSWIMFPWFLATGSGIVVSSTHCHISVFALLGCFFVLLWNCNVLGFHVVERKRATQLNSTQTLKGLCHGSPVYFV